MPATEAREEQLMAEARGRSAVNARVRELEADLDSLAEEYSQQAAAFLAGEVGESVVAEIEVETEAAERHLRRARAAADYLAV